MFFNSLSDKSRKLKGRVIIFKNGQKNSKGFSEAYTDIKTSNLTVKETVLLDEEYLYIIFWIKKITRKGTYTFLKYFNLSK